MGVRKGLTTDENDTLVTRTLSVIAQDPSVKYPKGRILMSKIQVPQEVLKPGPI